jgi:hypothetical protein
LGTEFSFPLADLDPIDAVKWAGFTVSEIKAIVEDKA